MTKPTRAKKQTVIIHHNSDELREQIEIAAYLLAEKRGFQGDNQLHDWLQAEARIHHIYGKN